MPNVADPAGLRSHAPNALSRRHLAYFAFWLVANLAMLPALLRLVRLSLGEDWCSYIVLIPFIAAWLIYLRRAEIFGSAQSAWRGAAVGVLAGAALILLGFRLDADYGSTLLGLGVALVWTAGFYGCYGRRAAGAALFPLLFCFLFAPLPLSGVNRLIVWLQAGSTWLCVVMFHTVRVPVYREGFVLALPGVTIRVAKECSSIRSSEALAITALLAGYLGLQSPKRRALLVLIAIPLSVFKNGVRIVTLTLLSLYVNPGFLYGRLHHQGGFVFFAIAVVLLWPALVLLARGERQPVPSGRSRAATSAPGSSGGQAP